MDLVDIDKVLDDLELNEEERSAENAMSLAAKKERTDKLQRQLYQANELNVDTIEERRSNAVDERANDSGDVVVADVSGSTVAVGGTTSNLPPSNQNTKSFVNISKVFSSLNEYVNADIDLNARPVNVDSTTPAETTAQVQVDKKVIGYDDESVGGVDIRDKEVPVEEDETSRNQRDSVKTISDQNNGPSDNASIVNSAKSGINSAAVNTGAVNVSNTDEEDGGNDVADDDEAGENSNTNSGGSTKNKNKRKDHKDIRRPENYDKSLSDSSPEGNLEKKGYDEYETRLNDNSVPDEDYGSDEDDDDGQAVTSASSITTSSPSSFSSGPSPGSSNESCSFVCGTDVKSNTNQIQEQLEKHHSKTDTAENNEILHSETTKLLDNNSTDDFCSKKLLVDENDSPEIGLSSISSYVYNENTSSSLPGLSQDMIKINMLSSISSQSCNIDNDKTKTDDSGQDSTVDPYIRREDDENDDEDDDEEPELNHIKRQLKQQIDHHQQPKEQKEVGFWSTMDEISDTELDSILQDIDSDLQALYVNTTADAQETLTACPTSPSAMIKSIPVQATTVVAPLAEEVTTATPEESTSEMASNDEVMQSDKKAVVIESKKTDDEEEPYLQNADSFSQASTIEFAESRLQSDFGMDGMSDRSDKRSTSSNSGTKNENEDIQFESKNENVKTVQTINEQLVDPGNNNGESHMRPTQASIDAKTVTTVAIATAPSLELLNVNAVTTTATRQLQRPNSLDLPVQNKTEIDINATAGQTPPASRLNTDNGTLSSSSCDDPPQPNLPVSDEPTHCMWTPPSTVSDSSSMNSQIGKIAPFWIPDNEASSCMQCKQKFSLIKRRHHCRACGQVLCSTCCSQKGKLEFLGGAEVRICNQCHIILSSREGVADEAASALLYSRNPLLHLSHSNRPPNPNNPMEYCSVIPPHQQVGQPSSNLMSVMVPVGVLKREGAPKNGRKDKNVIFSDGIRPGCDLTELDNNWDDNTATASGGANTSSSLRKLSNKRAQTPPAVSSNQQRANVRNNKPSHYVEETNSFIPKEMNALPPIYTKTKTDHEYTEGANNAQLINRLQNETITFAVQRNFYIYVKIVKLKCCIEKTIINFTTLGMHHVGQDEIVILLELDNSGILPKDVFLHLNDIYRDADKGNPIGELGFSVPKTQNFLGSKQHGGFLYIRPTFQCLQEIHLPESPFLIGILIHRWEVPWAKIFPLRLMLRLGAQYRYYPSPHVSFRGRNSVFVEIAQTIINILADFRNYSYTLATIKGMYIHMEDRKTSVLIPRNRYDQVVKALNNCSDHILALGANFSKKADGHLVCIQNMKSDCPDTHTYSTQAINIQGQPRKVTGASFLVLNGALKTTSGLSGKCSIVEDGLMVQILPTKMVEVRNALKNMEDIEIICGPVDADASQTEIVSIQWSDNDVEFNIGVKSPIDSKRMDGIPSIRVHSGWSYSNTNHTIRWTEVFIIQSDEESTRGRDPIDISKLSELIAKSTSTALVSLLDLLATNGCSKIGLRATLHQENVCYEAGSQGTKLAPLYMNALDNELIPTLHLQTTNLEIDTPVILELIFHILDK